MNGFEPISHTADIGFKVWGKTLTELFEEAAKAFTASMVEVKKIKPQSTISIQFKAPNLEDLLVQWLEELLYLFETKNFVGLRFEVQKCDPKGFEAKIKGVEWDEKRMPLKTQIKAVTYHGMEIKRTKEGFEVQVILDV